MSIIRDVVLAFFNGHGMAFQEVEQKAILSKYQGQNDQYDFVVELREASQQVGFYCICPRRVPPAAMQDVMLFITRANSGLGIGNFELNMDNGQLMYKTSFFVGKAAFEVAHVEPLVFLCVEMMDRYMPGLVSILEGRSNPVEALKRIEG